MEIAQAVPYRFEGAKNIPVEAVNDAEVIKEVFDLMNTDYHYYRDNFLNKDHLNFICSDAENPVAVSMVLEGDEYSVLYRTPDQNIRFKVPADSVRVPFIRRLFRLGPSVANYTRALSQVHQPVPNTLKRVNSPNFAQSLLEFEEKQTIKGFKFGILYCAEGQVKEDDMFTNDSGSAAFDEFTDFLGDRVELNGWDRFRAGLDVKNGSTGSHSVFVEFNNNEIMFHVSTMLPHNPQDKQQLEKKRHIGNDLVVIIFQEGDQVYRPTTLSSRQIQVVFLVKPEEVDGKRKFRLAIVRRDDVPPFDPPLPDDPIFELNAEFHEFFFKKLLNAEKASYKAPIIAAKLNRTRTALLQDIASRFI